MYSSQISFKRQISETLFNFAMWRSELALIRWYNIHINDASKWRSIRRWWRGSSEHLISQSWCEVWRLGKWRRVTQRHLLYFIISSKKEGLTSNTEHNRGKPGVADENRQKLNKSVMAVKSIPKFRRIHLWNNFSWVKSYKQVQFLFSYK